MIMRYLAGDEERLQTSLVVLALKWLRHDSINAAVVVREEGHCRSKCQHMRTTDGLGRREDLQVQPGVISMSRPASTDCSPKEANDMHPVS
jgi:hypothetical protein